ncbi:MULTISPECIES: type VI secretion system baseplate subunit TssE [Pseudoalteromonas]|uniref:type VI secretion system baseplate subunit TssE n=1 Tax=Pseudoalteromonas TaxID=53246 RepID=UPI00026CDA91|nr:type VI secretion system baseplate subunit TssE [Pseudoalteromonas spongiae]ATC98168.1 type VI secretion system protein ImpF [Pseudoalteromonas spongiae UST010723-006]
MSFFSAFYLEQDEIGTNSMDEIVLSIHHNIGLILKTEAASLHQGDGSLSDDSNLCFGIEDMALFSRLNSGEQIALRIKNKIMQFEPRLQDIKVSYVDDSQKAKLTNTLKFEVSAMLLINGKKELLQFDTDINLTKMTVMIENDTNYD